MLAEGTKGKLPIGTNGAGALVEGDACETLGCALGNAAAADIFVKSLTFSVNTFTCMACSSTVAFNSLMAFPNSSLDSVLSLAATTRELNNVSISFVPCATSNGDIVVDATGAVKKRNMGRPRK